MCCCNKEISEKLERLMLFLKVQECFDCENGYNLVTEYGCGSWRRWCSTCEGTGFVKMEEDPD